MAVDVGDAVWTIKGDTDPLKKSLKEGGKAVKLTTDQIVKTTRRIGIGMVAVGAAVTAALAGLVNSYAKAGDAVQKMALRTGFSTEALSELKFASEIAGTSIEALEKGIKRMADFVEDAKDGLSTSTVALDKLGLSLDDLKGKSPEDTFFLLAGAIGDVEDPLQRAALASDVFGRAGTQLLPLLAEGSSGIARLRQEANDLGVVFSQDAANAAAEFQDNMLRLKTSLQGAGFAIAEDLIPFLNEIIPKLVEIVKTGIKWIKANQGAIATWVKMAAVLGPILLALGTVLILVPQIIAAFKGIALIAGFLKLGFAAILATGPIGIALVGIAALAFLIIKNWEKLGPFFANLWKGILSVFSSFIEAFVDMWLLPFRVINALIKKIEQLSGINLPFGLSGDEILGAKARGGIIDTPLTLVGEKGPELIAGGQGARVFNAQDTQRMVSSGGAGGTTFEGGINVTVNGGSSSQQTVREIIVGLKREMERMRAGRGGIPIAGAV